MGFENRQLGNEHNKQQNGVNQWNLPLSIQFICPIVCSFLSDVHLSVVIYRITLLPKMGSEWIPIPSMYIRIALIDLQCSMKGKVKIWIILYWRRDGGEGKGTHLEFCESLINYN
jgi:hypothetical protein